MESKQTIKEVMTCWTDAMTSHNAGNYVTCLEHYKQIKEKSGRILYNMGCANIRLNQTAEALKCFTKSVKKDPHSAIAFFQRGVVLLAEKSLDEAMLCFTTAHTLLRGNTFINYKQLGLRCKLHLCEVLYNMCLIYILKGDNSRAEKLLDACQHEIEYKHKQNIATTQDYLQGKLTSPELLKPMTISADLTFIPPKDVMENLNKKNVMGKAKVVSSTNIEDNDPSFDGPKRVEELKTAALQKTLKAPSSPLMAVRRFLNSPGAKRDRSKSNDQPGMKGSVSMTDLRVRYKSESYLSESLPTGALPDLQRVRLEIQRSSSDQRLHDQPDHKREQRVSSGSNSGNTLSPINRALSSSFDTLTAIIVPDNRISESSSSATEPDNQRISSGSNWSGNSIDYDVTDVFIDLNNVVETLKEKSDSNSNGIKSTENDKSECVFTFENNLNYSKSTSDRTIENSNSDCQASPTENRTYENVSLRRRQIPPPPSYPPPPLPTHIVKTV